MIVISSDEKDYLEHFGATFGFSYNAETESLMTMDGEEFDLSDGGYIVIVGCAISFWSSLGALTEHCGYI